MKKAKRFVVYRYRGPIERSSHKGGRYSWYPGYSEDGEGGGILYPWMTRTECKVDAKRRNARAQFDERGPSIKQAE